MSWDEHRNNYIHRQEEADGWQGFHFQFMQLAREEQGRADVITNGKVLRRIDQLLRASCNYRKHPEGWERGKPGQGLVCLLDTPPHGVWNYTSDGVSENFRQRVRLCVAKAGRALHDYPKDTDPEDFWFHRLYLNLLENNSDSLFAASEEGGMIVGVCVASATFCARLEREALETNGVEERSADTAKGMSTNAVPTNTPEAFVDRTIASRKRMLESLGMPEGAGHTDIPALDAQKNRSMLGIELTRLAHLRRGVWKKFFDEASIPRVVEAEWQSVLSLRKMPDSYVDLGLTFALTKEY